MSNRGDEARKAQIFKIFLLITGHELHLLHATCLNNQLSGQGKRICNAKNDSSTFNALDVVHAEFIRNCCHKKGTNKF